MKIALDYFLAFILLILLAPIFLVVSLLILINMGKPIFFRQQRPGLQAKPFMLLKFRTMNLQVNQQQELLPDHQRMTSLGSFLRKTSLDELPQLLNILAGDMSFVGPRPLLMEYLPLYNAEQARRHLVKPGITGWAQINGRNAITWKEKFRLDCWYVDHQSLKLDLQIMWRTFLKVLKRKDVNQSKLVTMDKFTGKDN